MDLAAFADGIASVSLGAPVVMDFVPVVPDDRGTSADPSPPVALLLRPGDLMLLHGPARYEWMHGIAARLEDALPCGTRLPRGHRVSVTLRRMASDVHVLSHAA